MPREARLRDAPARSVRGLRRVLRGAWLGLLVCAVPPGGVDAQAAVARPAFASTAPAERTGTDVVLDVPYVAQTEALCGGAAVTMSVRYWGEHGVHPEDFAPLLTGDGRGIPASALTRATAALGWEARALTGDLALLETQLLRGRPLIALLEVGPGRHHYVTVVGLVGDRVVFHDPAGSPYRTLSRQAFDEAWAGGEFWALLVLPGPDRAAAGPGAEPEVLVAPPAADSAASVGDRAPRRAATRAGGEPEPSAPPACRPGLARGVSLARSGDLDGAERALRAAASACPRDAAPLRELAGLRLRQDRPGEAAELAEAALAIDPADATAAELLAAGRFLDGDEVGALAAWGRATPLVVDEVTLGAPARTRNRAILDLAGIERGQTLTPRTLRLGRRRLGLLPAAAATRLDYAVERDGRVVVTAAIAERPLFPSPARLAAEAALGLATDRGVKLRVASLFGRGEVWRLDWRWKRPRRRVRASLSLPVAGALPGAFTIRGTAERETYAFGSDPEEERRRVDAEFSTWLTPWLGGTAGVSLDRWIDGGTYGSVALASRLAGLDDRLWVSVGAERWIPAGRAPGFSAGRVRVDLRSRTERRGVVASARAGLEVVSSRAPRSVWPGAGSGSGRPVAARAHDLTTGGVIHGPLFGRRLLHGGVEGVWWIPVGLLDAGLATFADLALAGARPDGVAGGAFQTDVGAGIRLAIPGGTALRLDVARGLVDGAVAVSAGLVIEAGERR